MKYGIWVLEWHLISYLLSSNIDDYISKKFLRLSFNYLERNKNINLVCFPVQVSYIKNTNIIHSKKDPWFIKKKYR